MDDSKVEIPKHIGIIMDGNGRWASERGLSRSEGHKAGMERIKGLSEYIFDRGISILSIFAFSTENFKRSKSEVDYLMHLFIHAFKHEFEYYKNKNIRVIFSGRKHPLSKKVWDAMQEIVKLTENNTGGILNICLNYGGQTEIIDACKKIHEDALQNKIEIDNLDEKTFQHYLYHDLEPIDFVIRTSGEERISNFMLWQLSYAEFYFTKTYFPDFDEAAFDASILEYTKRNRNFGGVKNDQKNH